MIGGGVVVVGAVIDDIVGIIGGLTLVVPGSRFSKPGNWLIGIALALACCFLDHSNWEGVISLLLTGALLSDALWAIAV